QEQQFERVGGNETIQTHVRILAATNQDLPRLVAEGRFRKDLYYRFNAVTIQVPPLRARLEDVAELAHYFLFRFDRELGLDLRGFAPEALEALQAYTWPGNVRELQGAVKQAMLNASGHLVLAEFLPDLSACRDEVRTLAARDTLALGGSEPLDLAALIETLLQKPDGHLHEQVIAAVDRLLFSKVLQHTQGNQGKASELLGLNRSTLRNRLRNLGLAIDKGNPLKNEPAE
ncbi:MAG TPA: sigma 54-interacting transcriptional regulator, partial [Gemmataceae bacterium]|nr:sigma 54-interacting transcriptional regulator [Gemmataceae bacterium]